MTTTNRPSTALKVSIAYFACVLLLFLWYEGSLGKSEFSGLIPSLALIFITWPISLKFGSSVADLFNCSDTSLCGDVIGVLFPGGVNAIFIYWTLRIATSTWGQRNDSLEIENDSDEPSKEN